MRCVIIICRYLLALTFIFSGFVKGVDPYGFAYKLTDYFKAFHVDSFQYFSLSLSFLLCAAELLVGLLLLFGVKLKLAAWGAFLFMIVFTPLTLVLAIFNPVHDCGCFGDAIKLTNWETFFKNIIFFVAAIVLLKGRSRLNSTLPKVGEFVLMVLLIFVAFVPSYIGYTRMPLFDFRPYRIGVNIPDAMKIPEGAQPDVYKTTLYYQKDGITKEFNENNIPWQDSTWKFVDSKSILIKKGFSPSIESFGLMTLTGKDITDSILYYPRYYFLAVAYRIDKTDINSMVKLNELYLKAKSLGYGFACVTASTQTQVDGFIAETRVEYTFINADEVMLKTMIRSNPGLILLERGTIIGQWPHNGLPSPEYLNGNLYAKQMNLLQRESDIRLTWLLLSLLGISVIFIYTIKQRN